MTPSIRMCALAMLVLWVPAAETSAADPKSVAIVTPLMNKELTGIANKEVQMLTVEYLPGGSSLPHRHDAHVFVYVLEGSLLTQVDGREAVTLKPGETFYENPHDIHRVSANASATDPVKFLVFIVKDRDKPASRPVVSAP